jgi:hypothetical protein
MSGWRYATSGGWVGVRTSGGWVVQDAAGRECARSASWWKAIRWALGQRPGAGVAGAPPAPERSGP